MGKRQSTFFIAWAMIGLLAILHVFLFDLRILTARDTLQVQYIPDDAYYYLVLARNFSTLRTWTFDGGQSVTSGFHPLLAYLLTLTYGLNQPTSGAFVRYGLALTLVATIAALLIAWAVGLQLKRPSYMALLALLVTSRNLIYNSVSAMEWSLVLLFSLLYWIQFLPHRTVDRRTGAYASVCAIGFLGSLARSDFGLLPLSLFLAGLWAWRLTKRKASVLLALWGLAGATIGLLGVLAHNYAITGSLLQSSARMKAYWMQIYGSAHWYAVKIAMSILNLFPFESPSAARSFLLWGVLSLLGLAVIFKAWREKRLLTGFQKGPPVMLVASVVCTLGYVILYSRSGSIRPWYTVNWLIPVFILLCMLFTYVETLIQQETVLWGASAVLLLAIVLNVAGFYPVEGDNAPLPHQQIMLRAGQDLAQRDLGKIGSWNAGIIGYYQGGTVVNLDGLVNDDIYSYAIENNLPSYLLDKDIRYVVDFENVFLDQKRRQRGGYDDMDFIGRLEPIKVYDDGQYYWKRLTLYRVTTP